jgi:hypothetical protein
VNVLGVDLSVHEDGSEAGEFSDDSAAAMDGVVDTPSVVAGSTPTRGETRVARRVFAVVSEPNNALHFLLFLLMGASMAVTDTFLFLWLEELGGSRFLMGLALMCTCLSEVVVFAKEAAIKRALSTEWSIALVLVLLRGEAGILRDFALVVHAVGGPSRPVASRHNLRAVLVRGQRVRARRRAQGFERRGHERVRGL